MSIHRNAIAAALAAGLFGVGVLSATPALAATAPRAGVVVASSPSVSDRDGYRCLRRDGGSDRIRDHRGSDCDPGDRDWGCSWYRRGSEQIRDHRDCDRGDDHGSCDRDHDGRDRDHDGYGWDHDGRDRDHHGYDRGYHRDHDDHDRDHHDRDRCDQDD